jgi:hypothetical protein
VAATTDFARWTRGKILHERSQNPGVLMIEGQQFRFQRVGIWQSESAPKATRVVEVDLDRNLQVIGMSAVAELEVSSRQERGSAVPSVAHGKRQGLWLTLAELSGVQQIGTGR